MVRLHLYSTVDISTFIPILLVTFSAFQINLLERRLKAEELGK